MINNPLCKIGTLTALLIIFVTLSCKKDKKDPPVINAYAISENKQLIGFNLSDPTNTVSWNISGLQSGERLVGIDFRPANKQLYALGSSSRVYTINVGNGALTAVNATQFSPALSGDFFGFDFNPMVDRIRVVSNTDQNRRLHPDNGTSVMVDAAITPALYTITGAAYTNNFVGATSTILYDIDSDNDVLVKQGNPSPNDGTISLVGQLGITVDAGNGFDIAGTDNKAYAILTSGGTTKLYSINLTTGAATAIGNFPVKVEGLALVLE